MQLTSTLWGMEQYFNSKKESLFDNIRLPNEVDKQVLVDTILVEAGELEIIYTNGDFLQRAITVWFERKYMMFERWVKAINIDYEPLENYNRTERWTDKAIGTTSNTNNRNATSNGSSTDNGTDTTNATINNTSTGSTTIGNQLNSDETQVSAFNSSTYSPSEKVTSTAGGRSDSMAGTNNTTNDTTLTKRNTGTTTGTTVEEITDNGNSSNDSEHEGHMYGNIGVTTSQQMLKEEMTLWATIDIYREAAEMFVSEFCMPVY